MESERVLPTTRQILVSLRIQKDPSPLTRRYAPDPTATLQRLSRHSYSLPLASKRQETTINVNL